MVFNLHNKPPTTRVQLRPPESGAGNCESTWMAHVGLGLKDCNFTGAQLASHAALYSFMLDSLPDIIPEGFASPPGIKL